jgi:hypothetical protein
VQVGDRWVSPLIASRERKSLAPSLPGEPMTNVFTGGDPLEAASASASMSASCLHSMFDSGNENGPITWAGVWTFGSPSVKSSTKRSPSASRSRRIW